MDTPGPWIAIILGISAFVAIALAVMALLHARATAIPLSPEGKAEFAHLPRTPLQKMAWIGFAVGLALGAGILLIYFSNGGAQGYDEDPGMRMQILGLFLVSILNFTVFSALGRKLADERDKAVLAWAPHTQAICVLLLVAAWCAVLPIRFHDEGAVPTIFCYLMSGSVWLVYMVSFFIGILLGGWVSPRHAQS